MQPFCGLKTYYEASSRRFFIGYLHSKVRYFFRSTLATAPTLLRVPIVGTLSSASMPLKRKYSKKRALDCRFLLRTNLDKRNYHVTSVKGGNDKSVFVTAISYGASKLLFYFGLDYHQKRLKTL